MKSNSEIKTIMFVVVLIFILGTISLANVHVGELHYFEGAKDYAKGEIVCVEILDELVCRKKADD